ncbi:MAG: lysine--tRNA ligase [Candidatus Eisenbacteria sp.]|nr:lysine--tRNA ligase [Candidatus Eisenbacteria bacterium]
MDETGHLIAQRQKKLESLREKNVEPYPYRFDVTHSSAGIKSNPDALEASEESVRLAGRLLNRRKQGKVTFVDVGDAAGKIQVYIRKDEVGEEAYGHLSLYDIGDFVGVQGPVFKTRTGEITVKAKGIELLCKSIRPLPEKWHGLKDLETRTRQRYVDLVMNPDSRRVFEIRSLVVSTIRKSMESRGFMEVETPILQPLYGGANARPFQTHHNALGMPLYLRIAKELYLKRLLVGGLPRVFEIGKDFRNEGIDRMHNPEFTQVEAYQAYADYETMMELVEDLIREMAVAVHGTPVVEYKGRKADLSRPWRRFRISDALKMHAGIDLETATDQDLVATLKERGGGVEASWSRGQLIAQLVDELVEPHLADPTFLMDYPMEISPLAKAKRGHPGETERFEPFLFGMEIGNAFSELNDPAEQEKRFEQQVAQRTLGDEEAQMMDRDYLRSLEYGMPPAGGLGLGIDRLVMILSGAENIRDVILFPLMRPEGGRT